ncbi:MAG: alginate export family protein [Chthonomonadaceae bacterium]|nr:alginate export family protein [Chthonomonadaceae bacterium]
MPIFLPLYIKSIKFVPTFEMRSRFEHRHDRDFDKSVNDYKTDSLLRIRFGFTANLAEGLDSEMRYQYSQLTPSGPKLGQVSEDGDIDLLNLKFKTPSATWTAGRQKVALSSTRLVGTGDWNNIGRSWDAIRASGRDWDLFAGAVGVSANRPDKARFAAGTMRWKHGETLLAFKSDEVSGKDSRIYTLDHNYTKKFGQVALTLEGALQGGRSQGKDQEAWALHSRLSRTAGNFTPYIEASFASGGGDSSKSRTFDPLYGSTHGFHGIADLQGWKNEDYVSVGVDFRAGSQLSGRASYHRMRLRDASDAWYGTSGANKFGGTVFVDPTGASGKDVGQEYDLDLTWSVDKKTDIRFGVAVFDPGSFVRNLSGKGDNMTFGYLQFIVKF